ncbi:ATP-grasp fold amidoligase family protein [Lachnoclostridium phytofermentans]|uniref:Glycosyltransferase n=1 Tax=Lachnoclostridium phytofermentans (strain ATCC 700394 / DSM 18823 / ISDg) TaxID=357809 RepID=A9KN78_LACP7|nr:ATP-grasp fold amidoligase family protein [Lachnoclostridium phytofermentans]ABX41577.1 glycosyltransferase [Lachnoclostridium phytofermentans ISDg]
MNKSVKKFILAPMNLLYKINPELDLKILYRLRIHRKLNLENPKTYTEKLQWIKLYYKNKLLPICVDKYEVRQFVKKCGCENILTKLLWEGYNPQDIPFEDLPQKFVIKVTHGSGMNIICKNKNDLNIPKTIRTLKRRLKEKYFPCYGEWFYGVIRPRIIIEEFLDDGKGYSPMDYKIYCFHGQPKCIIAHVDRFTNHRSHMYDLEWNSIENISTKEIDPNLTVEKPKELDQLLEYARILSKDFMHVRVDLYSLNSKIYFGELTFTSDSGFMTISPIETDEEIGSWIVLP